MDQVGEPKPKRPWRFVWVLLLFIPVGFGHWYITVALLLVSALLTIALSSWGRK
jgi:hypothetical protein